ncbi:Uncharacterised protein [Flavonifractor plautii]|nr:Uncharacterised protein [Flavonifractor plautii]
MVKDHYPAVVGHRDVETALGHQRQKADGLEGHGLAAGVGAGDDQRVEALPQPQVVGHRLGRVQQGMAGLFQLDTAPAQPGLAGIHPGGQLGPGKDHVQHHQQIVVLDDILFMPGAVGGELPQDALYLLFLPGLELPQLVVGLDHPHRLDKKGAAGAGHVVDQAGNVVFVLRLHRHHIPAGAHGDDGLLEVLGLRGGDQLLQDVPHLGGRGPDVPPNVGQLRAGGVGDLVLPQNGGGNLVLQEAVGGQGGEKVVDAGLLIPLPGGVVPGGPGAAQQGGDVQQLPGVQRAPHVGPLEGSGHRLDTGQRRRAPQDQHTQGRRGLGQSALHVVGVREWPQGPAALLALLCHRLVGQKPQHAGQFQSLNGFFKQIGHSSCFPSKHRGSRLQASTQSHWIYLMDRIYHSLFLHPMQYFMHRFLRADCTFCTGPQ